MAISGLAPAAWRATAMSERPPAAKKPPVMMENARRDGFRPGLLTGAEDEDEEVVAAEEHRLSARALTAITGIRLRIDVIIGPELSGVWARLCFAGVFLCNLLWGPTARVGHLKSDNKPRRFSDVQATATRSVAGWYRVHISKNRRLIKMSKFLPPIAQLVERRTVDLSILQRKTCVQYP